MRLNKALAAVVMIVLGILLSVSAQAQTFLTNGLVAYYPFNGNANDASGNEQNGLTYGSISFGTDRFGSPNGAIVFSTNTPGSVRVQGKRLPTGNTARSFSFWHKANYDQMGGYVTVDGQFHTTGTIFICGTALNWTNCLTVQLYGQTNQMVDMDIDQPFRPVFGIYTFKEDTLWHHVAVLYDGFYVSIYYDGELRAQRVMIIDTEGQDLLIGQAFWPNYQYAGAIDELRIYSRALSESEVSAIYTESNLKDISLYPGFTIQGVVDTTYSVQYTTNLDAPIWTALANVTMTNTNHLFLDTSASTSTQPRRFYRTVLFP